MNSNETKAVSRLIQAFVQDHPEYSPGIIGPLELRLSEVYDEVLQGTYVAKSDEKLERESEAVGIDRSHYLDLINLATHAATNQPLKE